MLDIGSGGGFPGVPLALALKQTRFVLIERSTVKCQFLMHARMALNLSNVSVVAEDVRTYAKRGDETFDAITARAVAKPELIWDWSKELLSNAGQLVLQTSQAFFGPLPQARIEQSHKVPRGFVTTVKRSA